MRPNSLMFISLAYGIYMLGFYINKSVEVFKGVTLSDPTIPISTNFFLVLIFIVFVLEIGLTVINRLFGDD